MTQETQETQEIQPNLQDGLFLNYKKTPTDKIILDLDNELLNGISNSYTKFADLIKTTTPKNDFYYIFLNMSTEELMFLLAKNYIFTIDKIKKDQKIPDYFSTLDKIMFYSAKAILSGEELQEFMVFENVIDDIDQFMYLLDLNKDRKTLEMLNHMFVDLTMTGEMER